MNKSAIKPFKLSPYLAGWLTRVDEANYNIKQLRDAIKKVRSADLSKKVRDLFPKETQKFLYKPKSTGKIVHGNNSIISPTTYGYYTSKSQGATLSPKIGEPMDELVEFKTNPEAVAKDYIYNIQQLFRAKGIPYGTNLWEKALKSNINRIPSITARLENNLTRVAPVYTEPLNLRRWSWEGFGEQMGVNPKFRSFDEFKKIHEDSVNALNNLYDKNRLVPTMYNSALTEITRKLYGTRKQWSEVEDYNKFLEDQINRAKELFNRPRYSV